MTDKQRFIMEAITFEGLPAVATLILSKLSDLEKLILENQPAPVAEQNDNMNLAETALFLDIAEPTIYTKVSKGELPSFKFGNRLWFSRKELTALILKGRKPFKPEIDADADAHLLNLKRIAVNKIGISVPKKAGL